MLIFLICWNLHFALTFHGFVWVLCLNFLRVFFNQIKVSLYYFPTEGEMVKDIKIKYHCYWNILRIKLAKQNWRQGVGWEDVRNHDYGYWGGIIGFYFVWCKYCFKVFFSNMRFELIKKNILIQTILQFTFHPKKTCSTEIWQKASC